MHVLSAWLDLSCELFLSGFESFACSLLIQLLLLPGTYHVVEVLFYINLKL